MKVEWFRFNGEKKIVEGNTPANIVTKMRESDITEATTDHAYMVDYASKTVWYNNEGVKDTDPEAFIKDLITIGHMKLIE